MNLVFGVKKVMAGALARHDLLTTFLELVGRLRAGGESGIDRMGRIDL